MYELNLDILKMYVHTEKDLSIWSRLSKVMSIADRQIDIRRQMRLNTTLHLRVVINSYESECASSDRAGSRKYSRRCSVFDDRVTP